MACGSETPPAESTVDPRAQSSPPTVALAATATPSGGGAPGQEPAANAATETPPPAAVRSGPTPAQATETPERVGAPTAEPPTPTRGRVTQQDGAVILARPTPTPTPVPTPTRTPPPPPDTPYWKLFSQAQYEEFLPPTGPIDWTTPRECRERATRDPFLHESTPKEMLDRMEWDYESHGPIVSGLVREHRGGRILARAIIERVQELDWERFGNNPRRVSAVCGHVYALHTQIPVVRVTFNMNASTGDWTDPETGDRHPIIEAYRLEARYIYADDVIGRRELEPLGPVLIEPLGSFCDRDDIIIQDQSQPACNIPGN